MALTDDEKAAVRGYMGYATIGTGSLSAAREMAFSDVTYFGVSLDGSSQDPGGGILSNLSSYAETRVRTFFLPALRLREQDIQDAASNLDTDRAAVWVRNKDEMAERRQAFDHLRRDLCGFLGFPPGSALASSGSMGRLVRS